MPPKIYVIILQYNNFQDTIECLNSVSKISYPNFKAIVIDNASNSEYADNIKKWINSQANLHGSLSLVSNPLNSGYSGGNNLGIKFALESGTDYVLILNNDATVSSDILEKLVKTAESDSKIGIVSPLINEGDRTVCGGWIKWLKPQLSHIKKLKIENSRFYIPGVCMLIKKDVFEKIGMLDERYFLYFEDADFSLRTKRAGFKLAVATDTAVNHKVSASTKKLGSPLLLYYHYRNALYFNLKNGPWYIKILVWSWSIIIILRQMIKIILKIKTEHSKTILKGVKDFYLQSYGKSRN